MHLLKRGIQGKSKILNRLFKKNPVLSTQIKSFYAFMLDDLQKV